ncbi:GH23859 [Drosophila grimshawi]|uniref:GH23859 n=1 Tax=Drosophila grimshawi TaxID=7222 RepID=B4K1A4_DROGR|nr:GH23859 [Drosophila grimshawi]
MSGQGLYAIEKLDGENYVVWSVHMKSVLVHNDLWPIVSGRIVKSESATLAEKAEFDTRDEKALANLPEGKRAIGCKWVPGVKIGKDGYEELNALTKRVAELTERISIVEKELFPLQCGNKEQTSKIEELNVENTSLRTEAIKWRQLANALVEKSNWNHEEFKRLQAERESLAKLLTT